jgi:hypothetical protein
MNNGGDVLASGRSRRAQFPPAKTDRATWEAAFADFDPEVFRKKTADEAEARNKQLDERDNAQG